MAIGVVKADGCTVAVIRPLDPARAIARRDELIALHWNDPEGLARALQGLTAEQRYRFVGLLGRDDDRPEAQFVLDPRTHAVLGEVESGDSLTLYEALLALPT